MNTSKFHNRLDRAFILSDVGQKCLGLCPHREAQGVGTAHCPDCYQCLQPRLTTRTYYLSPLSSRNLMTWSWKLWADPSQHSKDWKVSKDAAFGAKTGRIPSNQDKQASTSNTSCWSSKSSKQLRVKSNRIGVHFSMWGMVKILWPCLLHTT